MGRLALGLMIFGYLERLFITLLWIMDALVLLLRFAMVADITASLALEVNSI